MWQHRWDHLHPQYRQNFAANPQLWGPALDRMVGYNPDVAEPSLPSLGRQALNLAGAVVKVAGELLQGHTLYCTDDEFHGRQAVCDGCPKFVPSMRKCSLCGCGDHKRKLRAFRCPDVPPRFLEITDGN
jgi:hypothetical protein